MFWMRNKENNFQYALLSGGLFKVKVLNSMYWYYEEDMSLRPPHTLVNPCEEALRIE